MKPTAQDIDADALTIMWAWVDGLVTDDEARGAIIIHRQAREALAPTPSAGLPLCSGSTEEGVGVSLRGDHTDANRPGHEVKP